MCKFCEKYEHESTGEREVDLLYENENGDAACIVEPTPISERKHEKDGQTATLMISISKKEIGCFDEIINIPIAYCPRCGRKL